MDLSWKQKINSRSSTEADIVVAYNAFTLCLGLRYFIEGQVYVVEDFKLHQYNMIAMLMENNVK